MIALATAEDSSPLERRVALLLSAHYGRCNPLLVLAADPLKRDAVAGRVHALAKRFHRGCERLAEVVRRRLQDALHLGNHLWRVERRVAEAAALRERVGNVRLRSRLQRRNVCLDELGKQRRKSFCRSYAVA